MKNSEWAALIEQHRDELIQKCTEAFEMAMQDSAGSFHRTFAVVLTRDGEARIDEYTNSSDEAADVHFGEALEIASYTYDPDWEDDWYEGATAEEREALANETAEEKASHLEDYETWYEAERYIENSIDELIENLERDEQYQIQ
jgi:hypothetical protein